MSWYTSWTPTERFKADDWSPSRSVSSFFSWGNETATRSHSGDEKKEKLSDMLAELNRSANMLSNAGSDGTEKSMRVRFCGATKEGEPVPEGFNPKEFVISPDLMIDDAEKIRTGTDYYNNLDALHGRVILGTQIRKNVPQAEFDQFAGSQDQQSKQTFQTLQEAIAYGQISKDWVGFQPYLDRHAKVTHAKKSQFQVPQELTAEEFDNIVNAANYNMLNPDDPIVSDNQDVNDIVNQFNDRLGTDWQSCVNTVDWLKDLLKFTPPPPSGDGEDGSDEDSGEEAESRASDGKGDVKDSDKAPESSTADGKPKPMDSDLLSDKPIESKSKEFGDLTGTESDVLEIDNLVVVERDAKWMAQRYNRTTATAHNNYKEIVKKNAKTIKEIEKCFLFQENVCSVYSHGLTSGELDEHAFTKIHRGEYDTIYERKDTAKQSRHCLGILLDQSGSMRSSRIIAAREVVILLLEGLKAYKSIVPVVYGHSGQEEAYKDVDLIPYVNKATDNREFLSVAPALLQNIDGMAINHITKQMQNVDEVDHRYLLVISDGQPEGYSYSGSSAIRHTRAAVDRAARAGVKVFGIGICNAFSPETGNRLYGAGNFVVISDAAGSLKVMTKKLKSFLSRH